MRSHPILLVNLFLLARIAAAQHATTGIPTVHLTGSCTDTTINQALASAPPGGIVDISACSSILLSSTVSIRAGLTLRGSLNAKVQANSSSLNAFDVDPNNAHVKGIYFDCSNQPSYSGNVFEITSNVIPTEAGSVSTIDDVNIRCLNVATGTALYISSPGPTDAGVAFVRANNWNVSCLRNGILLTASGQGFVNGNTFSNMMLIGQVYPWHIMNNGGQINGNQCNGCVAQAGPASSTGWLFDGTHGPGDQASWNTWIGEIFDMPTPIAWKNPVATCNMLFGMSVGTISDPHAANSWIDLQNHQMNNTCMTSSWGQLMQITAGIKFLAGTALEGPNGNPLLVFGTPSVSPAVGFNKGIMDSTPNGSAIFTITIGTGAANSTGTITFSTPAAHGWYCHADNQNRAALISQTANSTTSCTLTNYGTTFTATDWTNGDTLLVVAEAR